MKSLTVFALAAILVFAVAANAQSTSDIPADQPQAMTDMQNDQTATPATEQQAPAMDNDSAAPATDEAPAPSNDTSSVQSQTNDEYASADVEATDPEYGTSFVKHIHPGEGSEFVSSSNEEGQSKASATEVFPDLNY